MRVVLGAAALLLVLGGGVADATGVEQRAKALEARLIAPCCFSQQVSLHQSPVADDIKRDIRRRLAAGESDQQILEAYVAQYGTRILAEPPARGIGQLLYLTPVVVFLVSATFIVAIVRRYAAKPPSAMPPREPPPPALSGYEQQLADQLRDLD